MFKTIFNLLVIVFFISACSSSPSAYKPANMKAMTQDQVLEMAKAKTFPQPNDVVYKDPKGVILTLDSLGRISDPNDYYQTYYKNAEGAIKEVIIKKASPAEKSFNEKVLKAFSGQ